MIIMSLKSASNWSEIGKAETLANILLANEKFPSPQKYGKHPPGRFSLQRGNLQRFYEIWISETERLSFGWQKPFPGWMTVDEWRYKEHGQHNELMGGFDEQYFSDEELLNGVLSFCKHLYYWGQIDHGFMCHEGAWQLKNQFDQLTRIANGRDVWVGGSSLLDCLPGVYWLNLFGPVYVDFLGKYRFLNAPAYYKEELKDGGFLLLTAPNPFSYTDPSVRLMEEKIVDCLGRDAFFERYNPRKPCRTPKWELQQASLGRPITVEIYDPVQDAIPDVGIFISRAGVLAEVFTQRFEDVLDYSAESLKRVDDFILAKSYRHPDPWRTKNGRQLIQELVAYYGEVLLRGCSGSWAVREEAKGKHPVIVIGTPTSKYIEYVFTRIDKLWSERERGDSLYTRYYLISTSRLQELEFQIDRL